MRYAAIFFTTKQLPGKCHIKQAKQEDLMLVSGSWT